jgi:hypothetical protein
MTSDAQRAAGYLLPNPLTGYPTICVSFLIPDALEYRGAVRGQLKALGDWWMWEKSYEPGDRRAAQAARIFEQLIAETLGFGNDCFPDTSGCWEYGNTSYIIEYFPNHPHDQNTPVGYLFPPWYIAPPINLIGAPNGAAVTDIARFPYVPGQPAESLPRFRVHFTGTGVIELHLVRINFGGNAIIQVDNDLLQVEVVGLNQDNVAIPPETEDVIIIERTFTTPGAHHIDVTIVPVLQNDIPPVYFGGGLMKIVTCGFDNMAESIEWRTIALDAQCDQLQWKYTTEDDTAWRNVGSPICDGSPGVPGDDGREIELSAIAIDDLCKQVRWRYVGESSWTNLAVICDGAQGEQGLPGECPECPPTGTVPSEETDPDTSENNCAGAFGVANIVRETFFYNLDQLEVIGMGFDAAINLITLNLKETLDALPIIGLLTASLQTIVTLGIPAVRLQVSGPEFIDDITCMLYCAVEEEGAFNQTSFDAWIAEMSGAGVQPQFIDLAQNHIGYAALSRKYAIYSLNADARCGPLCNCVVCSEEEMYHNFVQNPVTDNFGWSLVAAGIPADWSCGDATFNAENTWSGSRTTSGWTVGTAPFSMGIQRNFGAGFVLCKAHVVIGNSTGKTNTRISVLWVKRKSDGIWQSLVCQRRSIGNNNGPSLSWEGDPIEITDMLVACGVGGGTMTISRVELNYTP